MTTSTLTAMPEAFSAGTTLSYLRSLSGYDPASDQLKVYIAGPVVVSVVGTSESGSYRVTFDAATTAPLPAGAYQWVERVTTAGGEVIDLYMGSVIVSPNLDTATDGDLQTWAEKTLPLVEAAIAGRIPSGMENYQIAGRAMSKIPIRELVILRDRLQREVTMTRNPGKLGRSVKISFPPVGG